MFSLISKYRYIHNTKITLKNSTKNIYIRYNKISKQNIKNCVYFVHHFENIIFKLFKQNFLKKLGCVVNYAYIFLNEISPSYLSLSYHLKLNLMKSHRKQLIQSHIINLR